MCEKPKGYQSALECHKCEINTHVKCVVVDKVKLEQYKKNVENYECYRGLSSNSSTPTNEAVTQNSGDTIVIKEDVQCNKCDFKSNDNYILKTHERSHEDAWLVKCK